MPKVQEMGFQELFVEDTFPLRCIKVTFLIPNQPFPSEVSGPFDSHSAPLTFQLPGATSVISLQRLHICFLHGSFHWSAGASTGPIRGEVHISSDYWLRADIWLYLRVGSWIWRAWFSHSVVWTLEAWRGTSPHKTLDGKMKPDGFWRSCMHHVLDVPDSNRAVFIRMVEGKFSRNETMCTLMERYSVWGCPMCPKLCLCKNLWS